MDRPQNGQSFLTLRQSGVTSPNLVTLPSTFSHSSKKTFLTQTECVVDYKKILFLKNLGRPWPLFSFLFNV